MHGIDQGGVRPSGRTVACLWIIVLYSNLPIYVGTFVMPLVQPLYWIASLFLLVLFLAVGSAYYDARQLLPPLYTVLLCYACLCLAWYVGQGGGDPAVLRQRLLGLAVCALSYLVFTTTPDALRAARLTLLVVVVLSVLINAWDITHPFALVPSYSEFATVGRAAGLYINPNEAGVALVAGFSLTVSIIPIRWRFVYLALLAAGIGVTFSRAAVLGFALVSFLLVVRGTLPARELAKALAALLIVAVLGWMAFRIEVQERYHVDPEMAADRLLWAFDPGGRADFSQEERLQLLERGWDKFLASPLLGNGVGSTELWDARSSTHNIYVMLASDFGVLGLLAFPAIVVAAMWRSLRKLGDATTTGLFLLFWGFFSHNVLGEFYLLVALAMIAALARAEQAASAQPARAKAPRSAVDPRPAGLGTATQVRV